MKIETDYRALIGNVIWAWILAFIPTAIVAWTISQTSYEISGTVLSAKSGLITKTIDNIDLYRVKNISAADSPLSGGKVIITNQDGTTKELRFIKSPELAAQQLRAVVDEQRRDHGTTTHEVF
ncbi:PH domain-containing protein [Propionibacterium freudenreichii]|uniref:PH domain-containing protein n=1 Tax=Propionibacterium freudenreichii TaxID=1744 RepID=UPI00049EC186|nr:PH domain-containing protein [Propionibacterium freudenreichii]CDP49233.1 Putative uncharacterized protein [Propionibacterium freudenreichii subsp. freudenreichii]